jgi:hypothetical protein
VSDPSAPDGRGWPTPGESRRRTPESVPADDGWGPSTAVYAGSGRGGSGSPAPSRAGRSGSSHGIGRAFAPGVGDVDDWSSPRRATADDRRLQRSIEALRPQRAPERGLPWWAALLVLIAIAAIGGLIDTIGSIQVKGGFNFGIIAASVIAILAVKRSHMFPVVIAPPIVYSGAALFQLYVRSSGLSDRRVVLDAAANYLVYGFPAIAAATAAVLIIAGIRLIVRK